MNERIKELSIEAGFPEWSNHAIEFELEQFAELIVQEYIGILEEEIKLVEGYKSIEGKVDIIKCHQSKIYHFNKVIVKSKKHFGVAEREQ